LITIVFKVIPRLIIRPADPAQIRFYLCPRPARWPSIDRALGSSDGPSGRAAPVCGRALLEL
jgi:hypothetical protein